MNCHSSAVNQTVRRGRVFSSLRILLAASSLMTVGLALPEHAEAQYSQTLPWNYSTGNPSSFSAYLNGQVTLSGNPYGPGISAQAAAGGSILGHSKEVFSASANLLGGLAVPTGNVTAKVFGNTVSSENLVSGSVFHDPKRFSYDSCNVKYGPDAPLCVVEVFPVGPFAVVLQAGVRGNVALNYATGLDKGVTSVTLTPAVSGSVYLQGQVDIFVVDVGVGASLTLINDSMPMGVTATLAPNYFTSPPGWGVKWAFNITNNMNLLSGSLYLYADINLVFWSHHWQNTIFSWPGFSINSTLYNDSGWLPIGVPLPSLSSLSPPSVTAGSGNIQLTISGSGFDTANPFSVFWDGSPVIAQSITPTQAVVNIPSSSLVTPGQHQITVANGGPLGGTSNPLPFHVVLGSPVITQISPGAVTAGATSFTLTVYGASLIPGSTVLWNSTPLSTTHVSDSQLTAAVPGQYISSATTSQISVQYPTSGTKSNVLMFSVFDSHVPTITQTYPSRVFPGANDVTMHVVGTGFAQGATVYWSGSPLVTTYVSAVQVDALIPAPYMVAQQVAQVDVINPTSTPSNSVPFTIAPTTYTAVQIPLPPGQNGNAAAIDVNSNGLVAVLALDGSFGYLWSETSGIIPLPVTVPPGYTPKWDALSINDLGQAVGTIGTNSINCVNLNDPANPRGFIFSNGVVNYFPALSSAMAINNSGQVAGTMPQVPIHTCVLNLPALWQGSQSQLLDTLGVSGGGQATAISNSSEIVGTLGGPVGDPSQCYPSPCPPARAFYWLNGRTTQLPLALGMTGSGALAVNDFGAIVGYGFVPGNTSYTSWEWENGAILALPLGVAPGLGFWGLRPKHVINNSGDMAADGWLYSHGNRIDVASQVSNPPTNAFVRNVSLADSGLMAGALWYYNTDTYRPVLLKPNANPPTQSSSSLLESAALSITDGINARDSSASVGNSPSKYVGFWDGQKLVTSPVTGVQPSTVVVGAINFQLTVIGANFVSGAIVYWNGTPLKTAFKSATSLVGDVPAPMVATSGYATVTVVDPGGNISNGFVVSVVNPAPSLTTVAPRQAIAGSAGFTLTLSGTNFQPGSQAYWNSTLLTTTYGSPNQLTAVVPSVLVASPSNAAITVVNPVPGGGASTPIMVGINPPSPIANNLSPTSAVVGAGDLTLTVSGSGFDPTSVVLWNSAALRTTYISPSVLSAQVPAADLATAGTAAFTVTDTIPGGWPSGGLIFTIKNPTPQVNSVSPSTVQAGGAGATITVSGSGFVTDSQVYLDGFPVAAANVSNGQLIVSLSRSEVAATKAAQLTVVNPQPCDTPVSGPIAFTITAPPAIQQVSPGMARAGGNTLPIQITGSGFTGQSVVTWNGTAIATSLVSSTKLTATVPSQIIASPGTFPIRVMQQVQGGGNSAAVAFTVYGKTLPLPAVTALVPSGIRAGSNEFVLAVSGNGIVSTTVALWNGVALPTTLVSPNMVLVKVPDAAISSPAKVTIQLQNPTDTAGGGGGLSNSVVFSVFDSSQAVTTDYTSASAFSAAVPKITTIGFNGILVSGQRSASFTPLGLYGLTLSTPTPSALVTVETSGFYAPNNYPADFIVATGTSGSDNTLVISLPQPTYALGLNYGSISGSGSSTITLSNGHVFSQTTTPGTGKTAFAGFVSTDPITSLTLATTKDSWVVLNLLVGSSNTQVADPTPVPPDKISVTASGLAYSRVSQTFNGTVTIQNVSSSTINGPFEVVFTALPSGVSLVNLNGTYNGSPYLIVPFATSLPPGQSTTVSVQFKNPSNSTVNFTPVIYSWSPN